MKRILAIVLALAVIFGLSACSSNASNANTANNTNAGNDTNTENEAPDTAVWPDGDVKIYLSYPAGSIQDFGATGVKNWIADKGGVNVTVEYGDADGGTDLMRHLAKADPDGRIGAKGRCARDGQTEKKKEALHGSDDSGVMGRKTV